MSSTVTPLAYGPITAADALLIELITPPDTPPIVMVRWPDQPTVTSPQRAQAVMLAVIAICDQALKEVTPQPPQS